MGLFSSKKKKIVGVTNTRLIPKGENPQAMKDAIASYVSDYGQNNGDVGGTIVSYTNQAIDQSIVNGVKRLNRWTAKEGNYSSVGNQVANLFTLSDEDVRSRIASVIQTEHGDSVKYYYLNNLFYDYGHFTRQVLIDRYQYNPTQNTLVYNDQELYLDDATIYTLNESFDELLGPGFTTGQTPFREQDTSREYKEEDLVIGGDYQFDFFEVQATNEISIDTIETILETTVVTTPETGEPTSETTIDSQGTEVINNIQQDGLVSQSYTRTVSLSETIDETVTEDTEAGTVTTVRTKLYTIKEYYKCDYIFDDTYTDYFYSNNTDLTSLTEEEALALVDSITEQDIRIQIGYEYIDASNNLIVVYESLSMSETSFVENGEGLVAFGEFIPNLYFKYDFDYLDEDKETDLYKQSRKYTKKLGLNYLDLIDTLREEVDDQDKIIHAYMKFGVNFYSEEQVDMEYLFHFLEKYFYYCDLSDIYSFDYPYVLNQEYTVYGKSLDFQDELLRYNLNCNEIIYSIKEGNIGEIGTYVRGTGARLPEEMEGKLIFMPDKEWLYEYFRVQITENTYREFKVFVMRGSNYVTSGKWAEYTEDNGDMILPVDFELLDKLKGFKKKEEFLYNCMYIEFLTLVIQKVRWYQSTFFKVLVFAISVVVSVYLGPEAMSLNALVTAAAVNLAIGVAIDFAIDILLKVLSPEVVRILAIAAIAAGLMLGNTSALKGLQNVSTKAFTILTMKADLLVKIAAKIVTAANQANIREIQESYLKEAQLYKDRMEDLDKYRLENSKYAPNTDIGYLDEDIRYNPPIVGETVSDFIERSLNSNPALVAINYVHGYVEFILELPTVSETTYKPIEG